MFNYSLIKPGEKCFIFFLLLKTKTISKYIGEFKKQFSTLYLLLFLIFFLYEEIADIVGLIKMATPIFVRARVVCFP